MVEGDIGPHGAGQWLPLKDAEVLTGVNFKTLYRQAKRGRRPWRNDEERDLILVWVTDKEHRSTIVPDTEKSEEIGEESQENAEEPRSLSVPDAQELFLAMLDRATASLGQQIERLAVERDEARNALEQRSQEHERELQQEQERAAHAEALAAERGRELERERQEAARLRARRWWRWWSFDP